MKLPPTIKVGDLLYEVRPFPSDIEVDQFYGRLDRARCRLEYAGSLHKEHRLQTILHEVLHAVYKNGSLEAGDEEERVVSILGAGLAQVLKDNPELLKWIRSVS